ncbi:MAG: glutamate 5-kinase, partial [Bacillota bacterium]
MEDRFRRRLGESVRLVIKVGTSNLTYQSGRLNLAYIERLVRHLADLKNRGKEVILVSSGAIAAGTGRLGLSARPASIPKKQAAAAVGQGLLIQIYENLFAQYGHTVAQVLLNREDVMHRHRYINSRNALESLLGFGAIPIVNENDTVTTEEIEFGDNDNLSALVAGLVNADLLINLTDIDGLYDGDPREDEDAHLISFVPEITSRLETAATDPGGEFGTGGMKTKLQAARIATETGVDMVIARGSDPTIIDAILDGERRGTLFPAGPRALDARKRWIAFASLLQGSIVVDEGARRAIVDTGASLLPSGILRVLGSFSRGDSVRVEDPLGAELARGLSNYSSTEIDAIKRAQSEKIEGILGYPGAPEVIHRDSPESPRSSPIGPA